MHIDLSGTFSMIPEVEQRLRSCGIKGHDLDFAKKYIQKGLIIVASSKLKKHVLCEAWVQWKFILEELGVK